MGIQINGQTDIVTSTSVGGRVTIPTATFPSVDNLNATGIVTASSFRGALTGNVTGNITGTVNSSGVSTFSGGVIVAAGSTSAPSISPTGDSNTGIFFPSADTVCIGEGGTEVLRVDSNGNLGIGTNNPSSKLHINGYTTSSAISDIQINRTGTLSTGVGQGGCVQFGNLTSNKFVLVQGSEDIFQVFNYNTSNSWLERLRVDSVGRMTLPYQPSFRVYSPSGAANTIITFGSTEFNIGNHMNAATGVFTAPIAGRYLFTFSILSGNPYSSYVRIGFCKNSTTMDTTLGDALWDGLNTYGSPGMAMIFNLAANDTIRLKIEGSGVYGTQYGSFSGSLIG